MRMAKTTASESGSVSIVSGFSDDFGEIFYAIDFSVLFRDFHCWLLLLSLLFFFGVGGTYCGCWEIPLQQGGNPLFLFAGGEWVGATESE